MAKKRTRMKFYSDDERRSREYVDAMRKAPRLAQVNPAKRQSAIDEELARADAVRERRVQAHNDMDGRRVKPADQRDPEARLPRVGDRGRKLGPQSKPGDKSRRKRERRESAASAADARRWETQNAQNLAFNMRQASDLQARKQRALVTHRYGNQHNRDQGRYS